MGGARVRCDTKDIIFFPFVWICAMEGLYESFYFGLACQISEIFLLKPSLLYDIGSGPSSSPPTSYC